MDSLHQPSHHIRDLTSHLPGFVDRFGWYKGYSFHDVFWGTHWWKIQPTASQGCRRSLQCGPGALDHDGTQLPLVRQRSGLYLQRSTPSDRPGIPLSALVALSSSTSGSYDLLNIRALLRGKTRRIYLLATLILLSAVSKTAVSNLVAYEAYSEQHSNQEISVPRYLSDRSINSTSLMSQISSMDTANAFEFSLQQQADIANQVTGLLTGLKEGTI